MRMMLIPLALLLVSLASAQNVTTRSPGTAVPNTTSTTTAAPPTPVPTTLAPPTPVPLAGCLADPTPILVVIIAPFAATLSTGLTSTVLNAAVAPYLNSLVAGQVACSVSSIIIDSQGSAATALSSYRDQVILARGLTGNNATSPTRVVVVVQDSPDVTGAIAASLPNSIPIISAWASDASASDALIYSNLLRIFPSSNQIISALLAASNSFKWDSVGIVYSSNQYGSYLSSKLQSAFVDAGSKVQAPVIVANVPIPATGSPADDEALMQQLAANNPVGIIALVSKSELQRLKAARLLHAARGDIISNFFFITLQDGLDDVENRMIVTSPAYTSFGFPDYVPNPVTFGKVALLRLSALFDSLRTVTTAMRNGADPTQTFTARLINSQFIGYTGNVGFDPVTLSRSDSTVSLNYNLLGGLAGTWSVVTGFVPTALTAISVPASPLKAVTVCVLSTGACHDIANVNQILATLNQANVNNSFMRNNGVKFLPVAINTGDDAVRGMRLLLKVASQCNFITGTGRSSVDFALTPIVNAFSIPQIDYGATSVSLKDKIRFPFFSRVVADDSPVARVFAEVAGGFQWDRINLITTRDEYGTVTTAAVTNEMASKMVDIETTFTIPMDYRNSWVAGTSGTADFSSTFVDALTTIRDKSISRIVLVMVPCPVEMAKQFFRTVVALNMTGTHIFMLDATLCQVANAMPELRAQLVGSICLSPFKNDTIFNMVRQAYAQTSPADRATFNSLLTAGEFTTDGCSDMVDLYTPYAYDTAQLIINVVQRALLTGVSITNGSGLTNLIRSSTLPFALDASATSLPVDSQVTATGNLTFTPDGERSIARFTVNVQQAWPTAVVEFASWSTASRYTMYQDTALPYGPLRWLDNTTKVPKVTIRSIKFIAGSTVATHPGTILVSIFGFLLTILIFTFCYKAQKLNPGYNQYDSTFAGVAAPSKQN